MKKIFVVFLAVLFNLSLAQDFLNVAGNEFYYFRQTSAKLEAMGRGTNVNSDGMFSVFYNPALLCGIDKLDISGSVTGPYLLFNNSEYRFLGIGSSALKKIAFGLSMYSLKYGENFTRTDELGNEVNSYEPDMASYTFSFSLKVNKALTFGLNSNIFTQNYLGESGEKTESVFTFDVGIHSVVNVIKKSSFKEMTSIGLSFKNLLLQDISGQDLPTVLGAGVEFVIIPRLGNPFSNTLIGVLVTLNGEYQKDLSSVYTSFCTGGELLLSEIIALRGGYYIQESNGKNESVTAGDITYDIYEYIDEFTYGIGLNLPLYRFENLGIPLSIRFDYTHLPSPKYNSNPDNKFKDFDNFSLTLSWKNIRDEY